MSKKTETLGFYPAMQQVFLGAHARRQNEGDSSEYTGTILLYSEKYPLTEDQESRIKAAGIPNNTVVRFFGPDNENVEVHSSSAEDKKATDWVVLPAETEISTDNTK